MEQRFIYVYEKNEKIDFKDTEFDLEISEIQQEEFELSLFDDRGRFFNIAETFKSKKSGF